MGWALANTTSLTLDKDQTGSVTVNVTLPEYVLDNLTNQERNALQANSYSITVKVKSGGDLSVSDTASLQVDIGQIFGAKVAILSSCSIISKGLFIHLSIEDLIRSAPASLNFFDKDP